MLVVVTVAVLALVMCAPTWASKGLQQIERGGGMADMTRSILLGAAVLIATQLALVVTAIVWYVHSQRKGAK